MSEKEDGQPSLTNINIEMRQSIKLLTQPRTTNISGVDTTKARNTRSVEPTNHIGDAKQNRKDEGSKKYNQVSNVWNHNVDVDKQRYKKK